MTQVCASGVQPVCAAARSIWPTLASAASTLAFIGTANWGIADFRLDESLIERLVAYALFMPGTPLLPLVLSLKSALTVWRMRRALIISRSSTQVIGTGSIAILSICPLYIQIPLSTISPADAELMKTRGYSLLGDYPKDCPLELAPRDAAARIGDIDHDRQLTDRKRYLELVNEDFMDLKNLIEREVLLTLGLVPEYRQLRFLRSRSRFQVVVTGLQAGGYVLSVAQRLAQHLAVCPLEALLCFLSFIILLQLILEFYACSHYQRPLILCLNQQQFSEFWNAPRNRGESSSYGSLVGYGSIPYMTVSALFVTVFSALSIFYSVHYMRSCVVCAVAAFLFIFALSSWAIGLKLMFKHAADPKAPETLLWVLSALALVCSIVLAVVSTATHWDLFHSPSDDWFSWILPHVSS